MIVAKTQLSKMSPEPVLLYVSLCRRSSRCHISEQKVWKESHMTVDSSKIEEEKGQSFWSSLACWRNPFFFLRLLFFWLSLPFFCRPAIDQRTKQGSFFFQWNAQVSTERRDDDKETMTVMTVPILDLAKRRRNQSGMKLLYCQLKTPTKTAGILPASFQTSSSLTASKDRPDNSFNYF